MPPSEITATSVVPPPMSTIMLPAGSCTGKPRADRRGHRLLDHEHRLAGARELGRLLHRAALDAGDARRDADDHARLRPLALVHPLDEVAEHLLADVEVGDHAVLQRADGLDVAGRAAEHALRLGADREQATVCACSSRRSTARRARCPCPARRRACSPCRGRRPCHGRLRRKTRAQAQGNGLRSGLGGDRLAGSVRDRLARPVCRASGRDELTRLSARVAGRTARSRARPTRVRRSRERGSRRSRARDRPGSCPARPRAGWSHP